MHYKVIMMNLQSNKITFLLIFIGFPLIVMGQNNLNVKLASEFFKEGDYIKASELYSNLYDKHKSRNYYQNLIECYFKLNQIDDAENLVKKHSKIDKDVSILVDFAHVYKLKEEDKKSNKKFNALFKQLELKPNLVQTAANKLTKYNYLEDAIRAYEIALKTSSKTTYRFKLAQLYGQLNDLKMMYENYIEIVINNKVYLKNVKISLTRTISSDSENENNQLLKTVLLNKVQKSNNQTISELLIWLFVQEKNFGAALDQEKAMDQKWSLNQKRVFDLGLICRKNKAFDIALQCYDYITEVGATSSYFLDSQLAILAVKNELLASSSMAKKENWLDLEYDFIESLNKLGKTSYTILLIRDLAIIQAFRLHDVEKASETIKEALSLLSASQEDIAECKLVYGDILVLQNEIWDAILTYSQVDKAYKHDVLGHEAKFRRAKISYYQGDFNWAQAQLDVLKKSTSKLIANNAMELSLLIQDNLNLDTTTVTMEIFSRADLLIFQNKLNDAFASLDSIIIYYQGHSLVDEALYRQYQIKLKQNKQEDASELLDQIINFFSFDILADDAKFAQAQLQENYFNNLEKASELYEDIISNHQDSFFLSESRKRYRALRKE